MVWGDFIRVNNNTAIHSQDWYIFNGYFPFNSVFGTAKANNTNLRTRSHITEARSAYNKREGDDELFETRLKLLNLESCFQIYRPITSLSASASTIIAASTREQTINVQPNPRSYLNKIVTYRLIIVQIPTSMRYNRDEWDERIVKWIQFVPWSPFIVYSLFSMFLITYTYNVNVP